MPREDEEKGEYESDHGAQNGNDGKETHFYEISKRYPAVSSRIWERKSGAKTELYMAFDS